MSENPLQGMGHIPTTCVPFDYTVEPSIMQRPDPVSGGAFFESWVTLSIRYTDGPRAGEWQAFEMPSTHALQIAGHLAEVVEGANRLFRERMEQAKVSQ